MRKKDLKTGMVVELRTGEKYLVMLNADDKERSLISFNFGWMSLNDYNEELEYKGNDFYWDIVKIYTLGDSVSGILCDKSILKYTVLWERPIKYMTLDEVEKELGYPICIIE